MAARDWRVIKGPTGANATYLTKGNFTFGTRDGFQWNVGSSSRFWYELAGYAQQMEMWFAMEGMPAWIRTGYINARRDRNAFGDWEELDAGEQLQQALLVFEEESGIPQPVM